MDHGRHKDQEAKYEKVHAGPEVPYTVQTHLISTLLCKLVSRRRGGGAYHMGVAWTAEHRYINKPDDFKKTCTSWLVCVILHVMKAQLCYFHCQHSYSIFISTFIGEFHVCLFFNHSYGLLKIFCCSGMNLLQKAVYKVWPPLGNTSLHARSKQRALRVCSRECGGDNSLAHDNERYVCEGKQAGRRCCGRVL